MQTFQQLLREGISTIAGGVDFDILVPSDPKLGDYATNVAFVLAKKEGRKPVDVAADLKSKINIDEADIQVAPNGFLNFFVKPEFLHKKLTEIANDKEYGSSKEGHGKKIIIEYSSPNIAKPMHIGHLRSTIIGDALANVYEKLGYDVVRWNYIGDWGTQFGKVIAGYKKWGTGKETDLQEILELYVRANKELSEDEGRAEFKKLEEGDAENRAIWEKFKAISLSELMNIYKDLSVGQFDVYKGESDYESELRPIIKYLEEKGIAKESEGALIIDLEKYKLPPALLRKSDGATLYMTRDLASLGDRIKEYQPKKIIYVVANQQTLHFEQLFAVAKEVGFDTTELEHVKFGMVLGEDGKKLATREGKVVPLQDVMDRITALAGVTVKEKNPALSDEEVEKVAHAIGIGALKYNDLKQHPYSDIVFDWKAMLDLSGNSGPYLQYTYARLMGIIAKANEYGEGDVSKLIETTERKLMRQLLDLPDVVSENAARHTLNGLALYLYGLAHRANQYYEQIRILEDEDVSRRNARLMLVATTARVLKDGLKLLGIETLERI